MSFGRVRVCREGDRDKEKKILISISFMWCWGLTPGPRSQWASTLSVLTIRTLPSRAHRIADILGEKEACIQEVNTDVPPPIQVKVSARNKAKNRRGELGLLRLRGTLWPYRFVFLPD